MAFHRGNAFFSDIVANDCTKQFVDVVPVVLDSRVNHFSIRGGQHNGHFKIFRLQHYAVLSFDFQLSFSTTVEERVVSLHMPQSIRIASATSASTSLLIEGRSNSNDLKYYMASVTLSSDNGTTPGELRVASTAPYYQDYTYTIRGQVNIQPA